MTALPPNGRNPCNCYNLHDWKEHVKCLHSSDLALSSLTKAFVWVPPQTGTFPSRLWTSDLIPYPDSSSPTFPCGWRESLFSVLSDHRFPITCISFLFLKPLLPWTVDVFLLLSNNWGEGKEIKTVPGEAELNSISQFQAERLSPLIF